MSDNNYSRSESNGLESCDGDLDVRLNPIPSGEGEGGRFCPPNF